MGDLVTDVKAADPQIATRWQTRVARKMDKPVLTAADIDFILADLVTRRSDITEKQGAALILITNASIAADPTKSSPGVIRLIHYVNMWVKANWRDVSSQAKFNEADAYIAQEIARIHLTKDPPEGPLAKAAAAAADMVVKKTAIADGQPWKTAYNNVVSEVVRIYKNDGVLRNNTRGETQS